MSSAAYPVHSFWQNQGGYDDGTEEECGPGDAAVIPPGHNAWVVGNQPVVTIDFTGLREYAKS